MVVYAPLSGQVRLLLACLDALTRSEQQQKLYKKILDCTLLDDIASRLKVEETCQTTVCTHTQNFTEPCKESAGDELDQPRKRRKACRNDSYREVRINEPLADADTTDSVLWVDSVHRELVNTKSEV